jgi:TPP-dependent pyruvate/acetoin dehydrogenase alpha subunit
LTQAKIEEYEARIRGEVDRAQYAAENSPDPTPEDALGDVYAPVESD